MYETFYEPTEQDLKDYSEVVQRRVMNQEAKTASDSVGNKIKVGDRVLCYSRYDNQPKNEAIVTKIVRQGIDGTILHLDGPADPEFPHHKQCVAKNTVKVV